MFEMCGMINAGKYPKSGKRCDLQPSQTKKIEVDVKKAMAVHSNLANSRKIANKDTLYCLPSGYLVSKK